MLSRNSLRSFFVVLLLLLLLAFWRVLPFLMLTFFSVNTEIHILTRSVRVKFIFKSYCINGLKTSFKVRNNTLCITVYKSIIDLDKLVNTLFLYHAFRHFALFLKRLSLHYWQIWLVPFAYSFKEHYISDFVLIIVLSLKAISVLNRWTFEQTYWPSARLYLALNLLFWRKSTKYLNRTEAVLQLSVN